MSLGRSEEQKLPQEIFDNVIDHFHDDINELRTCALVCPAWLSSARAHLFHRISLNPPKNVRSSTFFFKKPYFPPCRKLYECIEQSRTSRFVAVNAYIRELHICEGMLGREWLAHEPTLHLLLRALHNLRRFEINRSASVRIRWGELSLMFKETVDGHILRLPSLTEIKLGSLMFGSVAELSKVLRACKNLRVLEADHVDFVNDSIDVLQLDAEHSPGHPTPLDTLVVGPRTSATLIRALLHPSSGITVSALRKLAMSISGDFADFAMLLNASISVENLEFTLMNDIFLEEYFRLPPSNQFDLSQVPHLQHLKVNIDVLQKLEDPLPWLTEVLRTGVDPMRPMQINSLKTIWVTYTVYLPAPYMDRSINTTIFGKWSEIDVILCGEGSKDLEGGIESEKCDSHAYDNLQSVRLEFMLENPIGFGVAPRFLKEMVLHSPRLESRNILTLNAFDTSR